MQIKEFEAFNLKDCLQQVRNALGPDAVILETRKIRKGGLFGWRARDAVLIVAATGITVQNDLPTPRNGKGAPAEAVAAPSSTPRSAPVVNAAPIATKMPEHAARRAESPSMAAAVAAARNAYARNSSPSSSRADSLAAGASRLPARDGHDAERGGAGRNHMTATPAAYRPDESGERLSPVRHEEARDDRFASGTAFPSDETDERSARGKAGERFAQLERAMRDIRDSLSSLQREQREGNERTVSAVVSAVAPAVTAVSAVGLAAYADESGLRFPPLYAKLREAGVTETLAQDLLDELPDLGAWSAEAQEPLAETALRDLIARRVSSAGPIALTPGQLKAVALIGPTGVGKTTTIAKLAAHFALMEGKRVALLTVDTYRIAAVEQLKTYSQIIDIPISVAYSQAEVLPVVAQYADYDLLLIDTAGRSQKNIMQVGELKTLLEAVACETHLVLSASTKERDMLEAAQRFSAARVERLIFSKLDETSSYGTLLNIADRTGIPLSYLTTGQKVPEDIEIADGGKLADLLLC